MKTKLYGAHEFKTLAMTTPPSKGTNISNKLMPNLDLDVVKFGSIFNFQSEQLCNLPHLNLFSKGSLDPKHSLSSRAPCSLIGWLVVGTLVWSCHPPAEDLLSELVNKFSGFVFSLLIKVAPLTLASVPGF